MRRFMVVVGIALKDVVIVDAENNADALEIAAHAAAARLSAWQPFNPRSSTQEIVPLLAAEAPPDARPNTSTCLHCGTVAAKELWGPGWIHCPACGHRLSSVGEIHGMLRLLVDAMDPANPAPTLDGIAQAERAGYVEAVKAARAMLAEKGITS